MKMPTRYFLIILLIFIGSMFKANGQGYIPMVKEGNRIKLDHPVLGTTIVTSQKIFCDTIIAGSLYKKVYHLDNGSSCYYAGGIREDTINQKVFFREPNATQEILLMDFTVNVGDTVSRGPWGMPNLAVWSINYSFLFGRNRRVIQFSYGQWVEGVGTSITGFAAYSCLANQFGFINSFDNIPITGCSPKILGDKEFQESKIAVYPNPAKDHLIIETGNKEALHSGFYSVFNILGQEVKSGVLNNNDSRIDLKNFKSGMYVLVMNFSGKEKVVKFQVQE